MTTEEREQIRRQIVESRRAQGLPEHVTDPTLLGQLARTGAGR